MKKLKDESKLMVDNLGEGYALNTSFTSVVTIKNFKWPRTLTLLCVYLTTYTYLDIYCVKCIFIYALGRRH